MWLSGISPCGLCPAIDAPDSGFRGPAELGSNRDRLSGGSSLQLSLLPPSEPYFGSLLASLLEPGASR
jgi:hypothetical protein